jgi:hypothetical protein
MTHARSLIAGRRKKRRKRIAENGEPSLQRNGLTNFWQDYSGAVPVRRESAAPAIRIFCKTKPG